MKQDFSVWKKYHDSDNLNVFNTEPMGQLWLKTKSIIRTELLAEYAENNNVVFKSKGLTKQFEELFTLMANNLKSSNEKLDDFIRTKNKEILAKLDRQKLVSELYKLKNFEWGGDYQNSLDKYLVSHYVKVISSYDELISKFEKEINRAVQGYVLNSWYNHWSSILIEHIFKSHKSILPTVGQIKSVDFFINNIPFDLKVTYFPSEYLKLKRKEKGLPVELTFLKAKAREFDIKFCKDSNPSDIYYEITEKFKDSGKKECINAIKELKESNMAIVNEAKKNPKLLSKWLYENQGEMRFGSENRIFLVLIDTEDFTQSWKLKRNLDLLTPGINNFLDNFSKKKLTDLEVTFKYKDKPQDFKSLADIIFVVK